MFVLNGYFAPPVTNEVYTVSPSTAQVSTVGTGYTDATSAISYTASGLGTTPVCVALFPASGTNAPTTTNGTTTFVDNSGNAADLGYTTDGQTGSTVADNEAQITSVNGVPTAETGGKQAVEGPITPTNGAFGFVLNTDGVDSAVPVVYAATSGSCADLPVSSTGAPTVSFGDGGSASWNAAAATPGTYTGYEVISVNPTNDTFQASPTGGAAKAATFTYGQSGSSYSYDETPGTGGSTSPLPISEGEFASYVSGESSTGINGGVVAGDSLNIAYGGATSPSTFAFDLDVPAAPTSVTATPEAAVTSGAATSQHPAGTLVSWTAPPNPDVYKYTVYEATLNTTTGKYGTFTAVAKGDSVSNGAYTTDNGGVITGTESAGDVVETAPTTSYLDTTSYASGAKVEYEVVATADGHNSSEVSPASTATTPITAPTVAVANVTGPLSTSTQYSPGSTTETTLTGGTTTFDTIDIVFNQPVSVASTWSMEIADSSNDMALLNATNSTASTAAGGTELIIQINKAEPVKLTAGSLTTTAVGPSAGATWEIVSEGGINGTGTGTPTWNLAASGAYNSAAVTSTVNEGGTTYDVTSAINVNPATAGGDLQAGTATGAAGTATASTEYNANQYLPAEPAVTVNGSSASSNPNTITYTCQTSSGVINVYDASGAFLGSVTCTSTSKVSNAPVTGVTFTSGSTYQFTESPAASPAFDGEQSQTNVQLAS